MFKVGIGQDSHRLNVNFSSDLLQITLGGVPVGMGSVIANSDGDVVIHALINAISSVSGTNVLGSTTDAMCKSGITDSMVYLQVALETFTAYRITHIAISIECQYPRLSKHIDAMKESIARACSLTKSDVGITATSGEGLTSFGKGEGIASFVVITCMKI